MVRSSSRNGKKQPVKKSKFNINSNDIIYAPKNPPGSGRPMNYLYGLQESDTRRMPKKRSSTKRNKSGGGGFVARKGNKKGTNVFIARFPVVDKGTRAVPWFKNKQPRGKDEEKKDSKNEKQQQQQHVKILKALSVNASAMEWLNLELLDFASYVRLSQTEKRAREYMIKEIQESCKNLFGVEDSQCQVFGSFAAQSVCVFESDIDLAIWGVVEPDYEGEGEDYTNQQPTTKRDRSIFEEEEQTHPNRKKQERIIQWKALIDNATIDARQDDQLEADDLENERKISVDGSEDIDSSIFVIDRTGDTSNTKSLADYKLEKFWSRSSYRNPINIDDEEEYVPKRRPRGQSLVSLSSSTTCSVEAKLDESGMEVSFVIEADKHGGKKKIGPSGRTRTLVVNSLYKLTRPLRQHAKLMNVRRKARVPIINMVTHFGFECDIAIGGHNGADTSSYASNQMSRFKSFSIIVVLLKVLLSQQGLDKPFTGGLGSYALYVLVASHIEHHLAMGGDDNPAEALYTFFFRYGAVKHSNPKISSSCRTELSQDMIIETQDGGSIDMKSCFQVGNCVTFFGACWRILHKRLSGNLNKKHSVLQFIIDAMKLELDRSRCKKQAGSKLREITGEKNYQPTTIVSYPPRPSSVVSEKKKKAYASAGEEAKELIKGYGQSVETFIPVEQNSKQRKENRSNRKKNKKNRKKAPSSKY
ncbi:hypothetical protein FRACYDRAFT_232464 [Fragilariopsis cylindrus CCMP1102]|uniref:Polymerase nucleotidyl transferase domain-containing protein n=1 Tax=Fragilariopsis cylindrus CCMP1102 TaxID=635003 RepID=A0A1E7FVX4_9STRA|nr:hypothetical protein FRACYDRAFT_232464 [Fragilariopsis cylindrus CCMP1102]|eukprot:OEU22309.1 hypothetical protein FRACYDRAFT_232464 [Fragilariopsis cylindrus CCMP1102]